MSGVNPKNTRLFSIGRAKTLRNQTVRVLDRVQTGSVRKPSLKGVGNGPDGCLLAEPIDTEIAKKIN